MEIVYLGGERDGQVYIKQGNTGTSLDVIIANKAIKITQVNPYNKTETRFTENYWLKLIKKNSEIKYFYIHEDLNDVNTIRRLVDQYWELGTVFGYDFD